MPYRATLSTGVGRLVDRQANVRRIDRERKAESEREREARGDQGRMMAARAEGCTQG